MALTCKGVAQGYTDINKYKCNVIKHVTSIFTAQYV